MKLSELITDRREPNLGSTPIEEMERAASDVRGGKSITSVKKKRNIDRYARCEPVTLTQMHSVTETGLSQFPGACFHLNPAFESCTEPLNSDVTMMSHSPLLRVEIECLDLEGRYRRSNIRLLGIPEGPQTTKFVAEALREIFAFHEAPLLARAHRALAAKPAQRNINAEERAELITALAHNLWWAMVEVEYPIDQVPQFGYFQFIDWERGMREEEELNNIFSERNPRSGGQQSRAPERASGSRCPQRREPQTSSIARNERTEREEFSRSRSRRSSEIDNNWRERNHQKSSSPRELISHRGQKRELLSATTPTKKPLSGIALPREPVSCTGPPRESLSVTALPKEPLSGTGPPREPLSGTALPKESLSVTALPKEPLSGTGPPKEPLSGTALPKEPLSGTAPPREERESVPSNLPLREPQSAVGLMRMPQASGGLLTMPLFAAAPLKKSLSAAASTSKQREPLASPPPLRQPQPARASSGLLTMPSFADAPPKKSLSAATPPREQRESHPTTPPLREPQSAAAPSIEQREPVPSNPPLRTPLSAAAPSIEQREPVPSNPPLRTPLSAAAPSIEQREPLASRRPLREPRFTGCLMRIPRASSGGLLTLPLFAAALLEQSLSAAASPSKQSDHHPTTPPLREPQPAVGLMRMPQASGGLLTMPLSAAAPLKKSLSATAPSIEQRF
ncbi:hypothetical protein DNTS_027499 [Danionella cerebrum]|uniref:Uncharacterized protein n=1 Tax=Danionella cerebrum TaxID=2873325 RepID=A0A553QS86_9TELE|nr:hypothetical protein DNTS_027499 [Danionella translucida]